MSEKNGKNTTRYGKIGMIASSVWVAVFLGVLLWNRAEASQLKLNEWGDALSGFLAGLAILWLVLSFFQQAAELRLNTEALRAQRDELKLQREETQALVEQAKRQAEAAEAQANLAQAQADAIRRGAWPVFERSGGGTEGPLRIRAKFNNLGGRVSGLRVVESNVCTAAPRRQAINHGEELVIDVTLDGGGEPTFVLSATTATGEVVLTRFQHIGGATLEVVGTAAAAT